MPAGIATRILLSLLAFGSMIYAVCRPTCHLRVMRRLSASISLNHGMPGKTKPSRSDGSDTSALQYLLTWKISLHSNVLGSSYSMTAIWLPHRLLREHIMDFGVIYGFSTRCADKADTGLSSCCRTGRPYVIAASGNRGDDYTVFGWIVH